MDEPRPDPRSSTASPAAHPAGAEASAGERELIAALLRNDRKAAAQFVAGHIDAIYAYIRHRLAPSQERVEDLVHETFLAALSNLQTFRGTSALRAWLLGIARHKVEDYYRDRLREPAAMPEPGEPQEPSVATPLMELQIDRARAAAKTQRVLERLPEHYRIVLLWRYWENRSVREIADATARTEKAVERLLARARASFRKAWNEVSG